MSVHVLEPACSSVQLSPKRSPAHKTDARHVTLPSPTNMPLADAVALAKANTLALAWYSTPPKQDTAAVAVTLAELRRTRIASADVVAVALTDADEVRILNASAVAEADADADADPANIRSAVAVALAFADALADPSKMQVSAEDHTVLSREKARSSRLLN